MIVLYDCIASVILELIRHFVDKYDSDVIKELRSVDLFRIECFQYASFCSKSTFVQFVEKVVAR